MTASDALLVALARHALVMCSRSHPSHLAYQTWTCPNCADLRAALAAHEAKQTRLKSGA